MKTAILITQNRSLTLFATHYFELTKLAEEFDQISNVHLSAAEYKNRIVFLHKVTNGPASQSYGLQVAALAGVPVNVIKVARNHLVQLEQGNIQKGVQPDLFSVSYPESELSVALAIDESIPLLGCVSRYSPQKNHEGLLKALSLVKKNGIAFRCLLVGRGLDTDNTQLVSWLIQYGLQDEILLLGQRKDVPAIMNALDLHVLPSTAEGFPNVIAEAMACETPCVSTDVGDAAYIIGQTGWLVPPADAQLLAEAIQSALVCWNDKTAWSLRRTAARTRIMEHFSLEKMVATYRATWENGLQDVSSV